MSESRSHYTMLTAGQQYDLINWLKKNRANIAGERWTIAVTATKATEELKFHVKATHVKRLAAVAQIVWNSERGGSANQSGVGTKAAIKVLTRNIVFLNRQLGISLDPEVRIMADNLGISIQDGD